MEKPLATTLEDAGATIRAYKQAGVKLMMGHILRFEVTYTMVRQAIENGEVGRLLAAYARRVAGSSQARRLGGRVSRSRTSACTISTRCSGTTRSRSSRYARTARGRVWEELSTCDTAWGGFGDVRVNFIGTGGEPQPDAHGPLRLRPRGVEAARHAPLAPGARQSGRRP